MGLNACLLGFDQVSRVGTGLKGNMLWKVLANYSNALKSPQILFSVGLNTVDRDLNQYKIVVPFFGAANVIVVQIKAQQFYTRFLVLISPLLAHLSRRLIGELVVYQWLRRLSSVNIFKHLLLWNYWANWTHISYGGSLGWGNESLFKCFWSHDQDGCHAHIW